MSLSVIPPTPWWMTVDAHLGVLDLRELRDRRLDRADDVALEDEVEVLDRALLHRGEEVLERRRRGSSAARAARGAGARRATARAGAPARSFSTTRPSSPAGGGWSKPRISTGSPGFASLQLLAAVVVERAHLAPRVAGDDRVADVQRAAVDEHRRDGAAADVEARLDDRAGRLGLRVRLQLELGVGDEQHPLEQVVEVLLLLRGDLGELRRAAPLLRLQALGRELGLDAVGVRVGQVDLVHGDDDRHLGRARVRDRLARLRHDAVVGGDDEHGDVRDLRAAGAHGGERLVARRVEEGDLPAVVVDLVRADVLRDAAGLGLDDRASGGSRRAASSCRGRRGP